MKAVMTKKFNGSTLAGEFYNLVRDITYSESEIKVYLDGYNVRTVGTKEKLEELKRLLNE